MSLGTVACHTIPAGAMLLLPVGACTGGHAGTAPHTVRHGASCNRAQQSCSRLHVVRLHLLLKVLHLCMH